MDADVPTVAPPPRIGATRGFLFADLRGYTAFLERRGAAEAAAMLARYRDLVRAEVAAHAGAEIRTEGDSFYVVFADASSAVACGLDIVRAAAEASAATPEAPIRVGIGVHAGETVETAEGYVGSAVNLAARLCAAAPAGQVLVSDTVRSLTAGVAPVRYQAVGRRRFKGIAEPVLVYRALDPDAEPVPARRLPRWAVVAGAVAGLAVAVTAVALIGGALTREGLGSTPSQAATASVLPASEAPSAAPSRTPAVAAAFPNDLEDELLALVDERYHPTCRRSQESDVPRYTETRNDTVGPQTWPMPTAAGVVCRPFGLGAPEEIALWTVRTDLFGLNATDLLFNIAGTRGARQGACTEEGPALEAWASGPITGHRLCITGSKATVYWTYVGTQTFGRARAEDADLLALLDWWDDSARLVRP